jgi:biotin carboxyl carrier protein
MEIRIASNGVEFRVQKGESEITVSRKDHETERLHVQALPDGTYIIEGPKGSMAGYAVREGGKAWVHLKGRTFRFDVVRANRGRTTAAPGDLSSPMPGQVQRLMVIEGDAVQAGETLLVVEAMKMQLEIKAPHAGTVRKLFARQGQQVEAGVALVELDEIVAITPPRKSAGPPRKGKPGS